MIIYAIYLILKTIFFINFRPPTKISNHANMSPNSALKSGKNRLKNKQKYFFTR